MLVHRVGLRSHWPAARGVLLLVRGHRVLSAGARGRLRRRARADALPRITKAVARWATSPRAALLRRAQSPAARRRDAVRARRGIGCGRQCAIAAYNVAHAMTASGGTAPTRAARRRARHRRPPARPLRRRLTAPGRDATRARDAPDRGHAHDGFEWAQQVEPPAAGREAIERTLDQRTRQQRDQCRQRQRATHPPVGSTGSATGARRTRTTTTTPSAAPIALSTMSFQSRYPGTARGRVCHCQISSSAPSAVAVSHGRSSPQSRTHQQPGHQRILRIVNRLDAVDDDQRLRRPR